MTEQTKSFLELHPDYEATIGIEVHVQLKTHSKIFCACKNEFGCAPNTNLCPVCAGHPGTLPVLNKTVVDFAIMLGLATGSQITKKTGFARKHYMYPDLPKNYQITQDQDPICHHGYLPLALADGSEKRIRLIRIHMEEDAGKNLHTSLGYSLVDLNRAGTPLLEIVSAPDLSSPQEARDYLQNLRTLVRYLDISDGNMDEGSFRADINVSLKKKTDTVLGTRTELKNINSFKFVAQAIEYELERQYELISTGQNIVQETRQWDSKTQKTMGMRSKAEAQDYRYFPEPDLPPLELDDAWIDRIRKIMPELPHQKNKRFQEHYGLTPYEADNLTEEQWLADFFEAVVAAPAQPKLTSNLILRDVLGYLKEHKLFLEQTKLTPRGLAELVQALDAGKINSKIAQEIFLELIQTGKSPSEIIKEKNLTQIDDPVLLTPIIERILKNNQESVAKYKAGNIKLFMFFVGQAMKETQGKAHPKVLQELIEKMLT